MSKKIFKEVQKHLIDNGNNKIYPENLITFANFVEKDRTKQLFLFGVVRSFIHELIKKENVLKTKLSENLYLYKDRNNMVEYDKTFSQWNKCNLVLWDLKDILCRMGEDID